MVSRDLVIEARRRAGLTQHELAGRLGHSQTTIARWETGRHAPSLETLRELFKACGLELGFGVHKYDDSYISLIERQFALTPAQRLAKATAYTRDRNEGIPALDVPLVMRALEDHAVDYVLVGRWAAALHGSPIIDGPRLIEIAALEEQNTAALHAALTGIGAAYDKDHDPMAGSHVWRLWRLPDRSTIAVSPQPKGTRGYPDLARERVRVELADGLSVWAASLRDLVRICDASWRRDYDGITALRTTLECSYWETFPKGKIPDAAWATLEPPDQRHVTAGAASPGR